ncbi:MAG: sigma-70 family RNA polymerase sigma factor [Ferruginibacter sp.]
MKYHANTADEQLIQYFVNGDPNAMATLVALYKDRIYTSIYSLVRDKYQAEEIFQAVFIKIIDNMMAGKTIEEGKFLQWAMSIAHHLCIEHSRRITQSTVPDKVIVDIPEVNDLSLPVVISGVNTFESHDKIRNMIDMLPEQQREVITLNHYAGLSFKEIAELMKCSLNNALETMRFGLLNLRKLMVDKEISG